MSDSAYKYVQVNLDPGDKRVFERIAEALEALVNRQEVPGERDAIIDFIDKHWDSGRTLSDVLDEIRKGKHLK